MINTAAKGVLFWASVSALALAAPAAMAQSTPAPQSEAPPPRQPGPSAPSKLAPSDATGAVTNIVVTAARLNAARATIEPSVGASTYTLNNTAIQAIPGGDNAQLNQVILQAPGVSQDSFGQLHIRDDHNNIQYRLNGVILPEGISVFSQSLSPRLIDKVELLTGALPAQYGLLTAGIINITTKSGLFDNGGTVSIYGGSHGEYQPSFTYGGSVGNTNFFVSGSYLRDQLGVESPDGVPTPDHDRTDQLQGFAYIDHTLDESDRLSLILGTSNERFQIPNTVGLQPALGLNVNGQTQYPSALLSSNQLETTDYAIGSLLHAAEKWTTQVSLFTRYSTLTYRPTGDFGELLYNGISQSAAKSDTSLGLQAEGAYNLNDANTLRGGVIIQSDRAVSHTLSYVLPVDAEGDQTTDGPEGVADNGAHDQFVYSLYVQNEWKAFSTLTVNYGLRFDELNSYRNEGQISPRLNTVWIPLRGTTIHAGFSKYFTPPPFELVGGETLSKFANTTAAPQVLTDTTPRSERSDYYDVGIEQKVGPHITVSADGYYKYSRNLIDEGQFGAPIILTPFNYREGHTRGVELTANYINGAFSSYANLAWERALGQDIQTSQFNFSASDLSYIQDHYIFLDHNQTYTGSAGAAYRFGKTKVSTDLIYGSGLRADLTLGDGNTIPNGRSLPTYTQVNTSISHSFDLASLGLLELRFDVINLFDRKYEIRDGTGVGVGAPQFGPSRGLFLGATKSF